MWDNLRLCWILHQVIMAQCSNYNSSFGEVFKNTFTLSKQFWFFGNFVNRAVSIFDGVEHISLDKHKLFEQFEQMA